MRNRNLPPCGSSFSSTAVLHRQHRSRRCCGHGGSGCSSMSLMLFWSLLVVNLLQDQSKSICKAEISTRIVSGDDANPYRYPYFVSLVDDRFIHRCGGTLIAPDIILTAAHCQQLGLEYALVGRYDTLDPFDDFMIRAIVAERPNPEWDSETREQDQMVLLLAQSVNPNDYRPVKINLDDRLRLNVLGIIGFGRTNPASYSPPQFLQELNMVYVPNEECEDSKIRGFSYDGLITDDMMCLRGRRKPESGQCQGDSGGPVLILEDDGDNGEDLQVGIMSWGRGCADPKFPSVASRTSAASEFIQSTVCALSSSPPAYMNCQGSSSSQQHQQQQPGGGQNSGAEEIEVGDEHAENDETSTSGVVDIVPGTILPVLLSIIIPTSASPGLQPGLISADDIEWSIAQGGTVLFDSNHHGVEDINSDAGAASGEQQTDDNSSAITQMVFLEIEQHYTFSMTVSIPPLPPRANPYPRDVGIVKYSIEALHESRAYLLLEGSGKEVLRPFEVILEILEEVKTDSEESGDRNCVDIFDRCTSEDVCCEGGRCLRGFCRESNFR